MEIICDGITADDDFGLACFHGSKRGDGAGYSWMMYIDAIDMIQMHIVQRGEWLMLLLIFYDLVGDKVEKLSRRPIMLTGYTEHFLRHG